MRIELADNRRLDYRERFDRVPGPYLAFGRLENLPSDGEGLDVSFDVVSKNYRRSLNRIK